RWTVERRRARTRAQWTGHRVAGRTWHPAYVPGANPHVRRVRRGTNRGVNPSLPVTGAVGREVRDRAAQPVLRVDARLVPEQPPREGEVRTAPLGVVGGPVDEPDR